MILELFAGPGGLSEGARAIGLDHLAGIELDAAACATRAAAGHHTIRADVAGFNVARLAGRVTGVCGSPVCVTFSAAGSRGGVAILDELAALIRDMFAGKPTRAAHRRRMARALRDAGWPPQKMRASKHNRKHKTPVRLTREQRSAAIWNAVRSAALVAEPARYIAACRPEWIALEQVPDVLPLWEVYAAELREMGYSAWCGVLNAADYGVPQTRQRAILIASRVRTVRRPEPTHYDPRKGMQLWGTPWVSMAEALGWGMTGRPYYALCTAGGNRGGADEQVGGSGARAALYGERDAGRWLLRTSYGEPAGNVKNGTHEMDPAERPAHAVTTKAKDWSLRRSRGASVDRRDHPLDEPAPTITGAGGKDGGNLSWVLRTNRDQRPDGSRQTVDPTTAPAPALTAKSGGQWVMQRQVGAARQEGRRAHPLNEPAPTITGGGSAAGSGNGAGLMWVRERPATTIQGDPRVGRPGHKDRAGGEAQFEQDAVRITPEEAAALQSFRPGYPFQGTKTKQFEQIGNAVPPLLAEHFLAMATGITRSEAAA